jgi:TolB protein
LIARDLHGDATREPAALATGDRSLGLRARVRVGSRGSPAHDERRPERPASSGACNCAWSPDGRWIAYETRVGGQFDIWLIDPEGRTNVPVVTNPRSDEAPSWAPDSRKIAFHSQRRGKADVYVVDFDGENPRRLTEAAGDDTHPCWGPYPR